MPSVRVHSLFEASINVTITSPRPEGVPAHILPNAKAHDELASKIRAVLREYKHLGDNETWVPTTKQLATYLTAAGARDFYAIRTLDPAGSSPGVDAEYFLDVLSLKWTLVFAILPQSLLASEDIGEAHESNFQRALKALFTANGIPRVFIPEEEGDRDENKTNVDVIFEMGPAKATMPVSMPVG